MNRKHFYKLICKKNIYKNFVDESVSSQILITTHSQFFIDVNNLTNTYLFKTDIAN